MKKSSRVYAYIADLSKSKTGYNILFYDFPGCVSAGKTLEETIKNGKIALQMHIEGMMEDKEKIPEPSTLEKIIKENEYTETEIRILIEANVITENKKRIDITLDENLINMMDVVSNNRSELISLATREYIKNNYWDGIHIYDIAKYLCIDRSYLYLLFHKYLKQSPQDYLATFRLTKASELLSTTTLSIESISNSCCYGDPATFSKAFKRWKSMSPSKYRKQKRASGTVLSN